MQVVFSLFFSVKLIMKLLDFESLLMDVLLFGARLHSDIRVEQVFHFSFALLKLLQSSPLLRNLLLLGINMRLLFISKLL